MSVLVNGYTVRTVTESQNWSNFLLVVGRDHSGAPGLTSLLKQGHLRAHSTEILPDGS